MQSDDTDPDAADGTERLVTMVVMYPPLERLVRFRMDTISALVRRLAAESGSTKVAAFTSSFVGAPSNIWMEGISPIDLQRTVDCFHLLAYGRDASASNSDLVFFLEMIRDPTRLNLTLNLGFPATATLAQAASQIDFALRKGVRRFSFFNYGFLGESRLQWIRDLACLARKAGE